MLYIGTVCWHNLHNIHNYTSPHHHFLTIFPPQCRNSMLLARNPMRLPHIFNTCRPLLVASTVAIGASVYAYTFSRVSSPVVPFSTAASMASSASVTPYLPRHKAWPYTPADFLRQDPSPDTRFYASPRYVTHIDDSAIASLRRYYANVLPAHGTLLDFCSSWISHLPRQHEEAAKAGELKVIGAGMSKEELDMNGILGERIVMDLNENPSALGEASVLGLKGDEMLDGAMCVVSIDYLTQPVEVLRGLRRRMRKDGVVHLVVSNRCFPTKAVKRWLQVDEDERLAMVGDFLWFSGWRNVEIVDLKALDKESQGGEATGDGAREVGLARLMRMFGGEDPLWVVRGVNKGDSGGEGGGV